MLLLFASLLKIFTDCLQWVGLSSSRNGNQRFAESRSGLAGNDDNDDDLLLLVVDVTFCDDNDADLDDNDSFEFNIVSDVVSLEG